MLGDAVLFSSAKPSESCLFSWPQPWRNLKKKRQLKALSSEMNLAEIMFFQWVVIKEGGADLWKKLTQVPPIPTA